MDIFDASHINTEHDVRAWCDELVRLDMLWHFDDDLRDVGDRDEFGNWVRLFTDNEVERMERVLDRVFEVSGDPFEHAGAAFNSKR